MTDWPKPIRVEERLPEPGVNVLAFDDQWFYGSRFVYPDGQEEWADATAEWSTVSKPVTHWLPLPPKPTD